MSAHDGADGAEHAAAAEDGLRRRRLLVLLDGDGDRRDGPRTGTRLDRVCAAAVSEVGVDGAGVTVMGSLDDGLNGARDQLAATGDLTRRLEDLQLVTGEGPCLDAYRGGRPVLVGDLSGEPSRWLGFGAEAVRVGAAALFSLPLQVGAVRLGTLDLYRTTPGSISREQLADALILASLATEVLLELAEEPEQDGAVGPPPAGWLPDVHADVHVAAGMVSAHADVDVSTALLRLRGYAFLHGEPIHDVAQRVITRDLVLDRPESSIDDAPPGHPGASDGPPVPGPENEEP